MTNDVDDLLLGQQSELLVVDDGGAQLGLPVHARGLVRTADIC